MLSFLTAKLAAYLAGGAALILAIALGWQTVQLERARGALKSAKAEVVSVKADLKICHDNVADLDAARKAQNAAVAALEKETATRAAEIAKARQAAKSEALRADHAIDLLSQATPVGNDQCARTLDAVRIAREAR